MVQVLFLKESMSEGAEANYRQKLEQSVRAGYEVLESGGDSTDAVIAAIMILEDLDLFNAGKGSVFTH